MTRPFSSHAAKALRPGDGRLTEEQFHRLAGMVADGRYAYPPDLNPKDDPRFRAEVRRQLRRRLLRHIARAIAQNLCHEPGPLSETSHAGTPI